MRMLRKVCFKLALQAADKQQIEDAAKLIAFDRQNHMGASDRLAKNLQAAIQEEGEALLSDKSFVTSAVNIQENVEKMKVCLGANSCNILFYRV